MVEEAADPASEELVQIGDLARRVGVAVDTLRAWERRYGLLHPRRSPGGFRLYSTRDEATVRAMLAEIDRGFPAAQAAKLALARSRTSAPAVPWSGMTPDGTGAFATARAELGTALASFQAGRAHQLIDDLFAEFTLDAVLGEVILPCLRDIGDGWADGDITVAQEHFASSLVRERLLGLARPWDRGRGPRAVLACPPDERHDIGLICFGIVLSRNGWRITFLGADTPISTLADAAAILEPDLVTVASIVDGRFDAVVPALRDLAAARTVAIAGRAANEDLAGAVGGVLLTDGPVAAANRLAAEPDIRRLPPRRPGSQRVAGRR